MNSPKKNEPTSCDQRQVKPERPPWNVGKAQSYQAAADEYLRLFDERMRGRRARRLKTSVASKTADGDKKRPKTEGNVQVEKEEEPTRPKTAIKASPKETRPMTRQADISSRSSMNVVKMALSTMKVKGVPKAKKNSKEASLIEGNTNSESVQDVAEAANKASPVEADSTRKSGHETEEKSKIPSLVEADSPSKGVQDVKEKSNAASQKEADSTNKGTLEAKEKSEEAPQVESKAPSKSVHEEEEKSNDAETPAEDKKKELSKNEKKTENENDSDSWEDETSTSDSSDEETSSSDSSSTTTTSKATENRTESRTTIEETSTARSSSDSTTIEEKSDSEDSSSESSERTNASSTTLYTCLGSSDSATSILSKRDKSSKSLAKRNEKPVQESSSAPVKFRDSPEKKVPSPPQPSKKEKLKSPSNKKNDKDEKLVENKQEKLSSDLTQKEAVLNSSTKKAADEHPKPKTPAKFLTVKTENRPSSQQESNVSVEKRPTSSRATATAQKEQAAKRPSERPRWRY